MRGRIPSQLVALEASIVKAGSARTDAGAMLLIAAKVYNMMEVHPMLGHPSEDRTRKMAWRWESRRRASEDPARCASRRM